MPRMYDNHRGVGLQRREKVLPLSFAPTCTQLVEDWVKWIELSSTLALQRIKHNMAAYTKE